MNGWIGWDGIGLDEWLSWVVGSLRAPSVLIKNIHECKLSGDLPGDMGYPFGITVYFANDLDHLSGPA